MIAWVAAIYDKEEQTLSAGMRSIEQNLPREKQTSLCYATSKDGFHWEKPTLNLVEYEGSKENNIIFQPRDGIDSAVIIKDNEDSDPSRRYKMMFYLMAEKTGPREGPWGLYTASSPDGLVVAVNTTSNQGRRQIRILLSPTTKNVRLFKPSRHAFPDHEGSPLDRPLGEFGFSNLWRNATGSLA